MAQQRFFTPITEPTLEDIVIRMLDLMDPNEKEKALKEVTLLLNHLNFSKLDKSERIYLIDSAIKFGSIELVKIITNIFIQLKLTDDITIPYAGHGEHPYRPVFWLAAVTTRLPNVPPENYKTIENYLCTTFSIPDVVMINGLSVTRDEYVHAVNKWKQTQNEVIRSRGRSDDRYTIPDDERQTGLKFS